MKNNLKNILKQIPKEFGIYKFLDKNEKIIYIGKSVNLHSRVNSYFNGKSKLNFAKQKMVDKVDDIKTIITNNETESLILETTLIKKHEPKYNILMKDGKNHLYIKITCEEYPKIIKTRIKSGKGSFFGPYISTFYVNNLLKLIKNIFGYGVAEHNFFLSKNTYNLDKYIFKNDFELSDYNAQIDKIREFLKGNTSKIKQNLENKMLTKAKNLDFEEANKIKNQLNSISILEENQIVRDGVTGDYIVLNILEKFDKTYVGKIDIKEGKIVGFNNYDIKNNLSETKEEVLKYIIEKNQINQGNNSYIIPFNIDFKNIKIEVAKIGTKKDLLNLCYKNIYEYASKSHIDSLSTKGFTKKTMQNLLETLGYKQINKNIIFECNDISHISGNHTVASRSIIENGKSNTSKYKKYRIKTLSEGKIDDFNSMREVMTRRLKEIEKLQNIPDLIIIDGGKGQLSSVVEIINNWNPPALSGSPLIKGENKIQVVGIAKKEEELFIYKSPLLGGDLEGEFKKIILNKDSNELRLVQKIRDEAHRFAITFNRDSRIKAMKKNILEELPGFGPITRKKILKKYGNIEKLKDIDIKELESMLNKTQIETLENHGII